MRPPFLRTNKPFADSEKRGVARMNGDLAAGFAGRHRDRQNRRQSQCKHFLHLDTMPSCIMKAPKHIFQPFPTAAPPFVPSQTPKIGCDSFRRPDLRIPKNEKIEKSFYFLFFHFTMSQPRGP